MPCLSWRHLLQFAVALIGAATMLMSAFSAIAQHDIKRVLAYSTMSQIGYMFMALGLGAWSAAIFHFMTHAFFKALLFLAAGVVIHAMHHEQDMFRMGGLRVSLPLAFWSFVIGGSALAGLPVITAGFFSKDLILWQAWAGPNGNGGFWIAGMLGAVLTSFYTYRLILLVFYGAAKRTVSYKPGPDDSHPARHLVRAVADWRLRKYAARFRRKAGTFELPERSTTLSGAGTRRADHGAQHRSLCQLLRSRSD